MSHVINVRLTVEDDITESDIGESLSNMEGLLNARILRDNEHGQLVPDGIPIVVIMKQNGKSQLFPE